VLKLSQDVEEAGPLLRDKRRWWKPKVTENVILFIDELHTIVGAGSAEGAMDASNIIKPALSRGELQCVGATTLSEYRKYIEKDAALERRFQTVMIEAPTVEEAVQILGGLRPKYEAYHKAKLTDEALEAAVVTAAVS
jgi:ATP-dependent Clp protease ATP-binding subunit ClpC